MGILEASTREALYAAQDENTRLRATVEKLGISLTKHNESVNAMAREVVRKDAEIATLRTRVAELGSTRLETQVLAGRLIDATVRGCSMAPIDWDRLALLAGRSADGFPFGDDGVPDRLRARVAELEGYGSLDVTAIARALGRGEGETILAAAKRLRYRAAELETRVESYQRGVSQTQLLRDLDAKHIASLEVRLAALEAPPVVPNGWSVGQWVYSPDGWEPSDTAGKWRLRNGPSASTCGTMFTVAEEDAAGSVATLWHVPGVPIAALRALAWAIENGQRPPHAADGEVTP